MKWGRVRLGVVALLVAACSSSGATSQIASDPPSAVAAPTTSPSRVPSPKPTPSAAYPAGWVATACGALASLGEAVNYRGDLQNAAAANDYYAIGKTGNAIALAAYDAYTAMEHPPEWAPAAAFVTQMQAAAGTMVDAGSFLKEGGENASSTTIERGLVSFDVAIDTATNAANELQALSKQYAFDCR